MHLALEERRQAGSLRHLPGQDAGIDFCSNDYLGFARHPVIREQIIAATLAEDIHGGTGSRLISGNHPAMEELEKTIATFHEAETALLFNSGYAANLGLLSAMANRTDTILYDELVHASMRDGIRLASARSFSFRHNDVQHLAEKIQRAEGQVFVVVESVYSMDGDCAPLDALLMVCEANGAVLVVDEAHAVGVMGARGEGLVPALGLASRVWARVVTFGKAMGSHGAAVLGPVYLRDFLINFARSFIYTTALPPAHWAGIAAAYAMLEGGEAVRTLQERIACFHRNLTPSLAARLIPSTSAIQALIVPGNEAVIRLAAQLNEQQLGVRPIRYPTVGLGQERLRICLHTYNTEAEIEKLCHYLQTLLVR
ncbi:MAG: 8-amino-7-oxononanoate synthase [Lewinellaceae bacterium]|nr:8-amino-7-oxononanoate synthase [Lewinellaceae bacterium]